MKLSRALVVAALLAVCFATASSAVVKFTCNNGGRVWNLTPGMWPIEITLMTTKGATDCDIVVDDGGSVIIALGVSFENQHESVKFGPLPGVPVRVTALKGGGPNSKTYLRASDSVRFLRGGAGPGLRDLGSAEELAARDPGYAKVLEQLRQYQRIKAGARR